MRIVHISQQDDESGGFKAAYRLHTAVTQAGHDSQMVVLAKTTRDPSVIPMAQPLLLAKIIWRLLGWLNDAATRGYARQPRCGWTASRYPVGTPYTIRRLQPDDREMLSVLETNLDDVNPQWVGDLIERLLAAGARDAWAAPIVMKKGRPALTLGVLCAPGDAEALRRLIFQSTPAFGIREWNMSRTAQVRRNETVQPPYGPVRFKVVESEGRPLTRNPEFEDCGARAREAGVTPRQVADAAARARGCKVIVSTRTKRKIFLQIALLQTGLPAWKRTS